MPDPNSKKQRAGRQALNTLFGNPSDVLVTHYSCESFYDRPEGASARITSIALRNLDTGQTQSYSIHQFAEREGTKASEIGDKYDHFEKQMLDEYFAFINQNRNKKYLHWNMRDINYGFAAIEHRYQVLGGDPIVIDDRNKYDLSRILIQIYGVKYTGHPRLQTIIDQNSIKPLDFMSGKEEADAFDTGNYVGLHQSTLRKVDIIANLADRANERTLKTRTGWWAMNGGGVREVTEFVGNHPLVTAVLTIITLVGLVWTTISGLGDGQTSIGTKDVSGSVEISAHGEN